MVHSASILQCMIIRCCWHMYQYIPKRINSVFKYEPFGEYLLCVGRHVILELNVNIIFFAELAYSVFFWPYKRKGRRNRTLSWLILLLWGIWKLELCCTFVRIVMDFISLLCNYPIGMTELNTPKMYSSLSKIMNQRR